MNFLIFELVSSEIRVDFTSGSRKSGEWWLNWHVNTIQEHSHSGARLWKWSKQKKGSTAHHLSRRIQSTRARCRVLGVDLSLTNFESRSLYPQGVQLNEVMSSNSATWIDSTSSKVHLGKSTTFIWPIRLTKESWECLSLLFFFKKCVCVAQFTTVQWLS